MPPKKKKTTVTELSQEQEKALLETRKEKAFADGESSGSIAANQRKEEDGRMHPLLLPSVTPLVLDHLHSEDVLQFGLVCKTWNDEVRRKCKSNPFLNPKILSHFVQYISKGSLLKCRLVCSLWNKIILGSTRWNKNSIFSSPSELLLEEPDWTRFFSLNVGSEDFERFRNTFGDPAILPLSLAFTHFVAPNNISLNDESTQEFIEQYGRYFKALTLHRCKWQLEDLREILVEHSPLLKYLRIVCGIIPGTQPIGRGKKQTIPELDTLLHEDPAQPPVLENMKCIELDMNLLDTKDNPRPYVEQFLTELFGSCPSLEVLNFDLSAWYSRTWLTNFIATNDQIKLPRLKVLKHLIDPDQSQIISLQLKQFPLTTLRIRIRYRDVTVEALHELFCSLKHTLEDLQLIFLESKCAHEFPSSTELYKLKRLELWKYKGQLDFLKDLVALEELLIGEIELKGQELFDQRRVFRVLLPNLKKITFKDFWETRVFS